jgi:hypothetical protein
MRSRRRHLTAALLLHAATASVGRVARWFITCMRQPGIIYNATKARARAAPAVKLSAVFQRLRRASNPSGAKNFMGLEAIEAAPPSWAVTLALGENPREVALVNKTTELGNISEFTPRILQKFFGALDALVG